MPKKIGGEPPLTPEEQTAPTGEWLVVRPPEEEGRSETVTPVPAGAETAESGREAQAVFTGDGEIHFEHPFASAHGRCDHGGEGSKYKNKENQDSMFAGADKNGALVVGVIDGAGGSGYGLLASAVANRTLLEELVKGAGLGEAMKTAHLAIRQEVERAILKAVSGEADWDKQDAKAREEGFACAVAVRVEPSGLATIGWAGDSKIMTVRNGKKLEEGTSQMQNYAVLDIECRFIPPQGYYTNAENNILTCMLGSRCFPVERVLRRPSAEEILARGGTESAEERYEVPHFARFQGRNGDQIVLASDGLWDVASGYEVAELAKKYRGDRKNYRRHYLIWPGGAITRKTNLLSTTPEGCLLK